MKLNPKDIVTTKTTKVHENRQKLAIGGRNRSWPLSGQFPSFLKMAAWLCLYIFVHDFPDHGSSKWHFPNPALLNRQILCLVHINVVVPSESKLTVATCNWAGAIIQMQTTRDGVNGGTLPCVWLVHATSDDSVTKQPHLSPQHYELNERQHVLDRTRVSVCKRCSKAMKKQQAWGKSVRRLNRHWCMQGNASPKP